MWRRRPRPAAGAKIPQLTAEADAPAVSQEAGLAAFMKETFGDTPLVVVANREPYSHDYDAVRRVSVSSTPGGLVTAIEPMLRATGGTWVAHGSGSADRDMVDREGNVRVPPQAPAYTLRRVFLSREEEERYYGGFSNEALWPLCHNAFTKPIFRRADWEAYRTVNRRFAAAALETSRGMVLLQDYHFALAGRFIRESAPNTVIGSFWHIPWPAAEIFAICPWKEEILDGLLALDVLGFHTIGYCGNFLDTVERFVDCKVDRKKMTVDYRGRRCALRVVPISIVYPVTVAPAEAAEGLRSELTIGEGVHVSVAVDRIDYTKGIVERYRAIDRLFERTPALIGRYSLVQIAAPSRGGVQAYRELEQSVIEGAAELNAKWGRAGWKPVHLVARSVGREEVATYYRMADSALVTPLHDGMNLVAKEYAASCEADRGVLVLSEFAGAAETMTGALTVNPYDADGVADAILTAIEMPSSERRWRIRAMHAALRKNTIFDWARSLLTALSAARSNERMVKHDVSSRRVSASDGRAAAARA